MLETSPGWFYLRDLGCVPSGPIGFDELQQLVGNGKVLPTFLVRCESAEQWVEAKLVPGLVKELGQATSDDGNPTPCQSTAHGERLRKLAIWHRRLTCGIVFVAAVFAIQNIIGNALSPLIGGFIAIILMFTQLILVLSLSDHLGEGKSLLLTAFAGFPFIGVIPMLMVRRRATKQLTEAGIGVNLFGPKSVPSQATSGYAKTFSPLPHPSLVQTQSAAIDGDPQLHSIATWHRRFSWGILGIAAAYFLSIVNQDPTSSVVVILWLIAVAAQATLMFGLMKSLGRKPWPLAITAAIPFLGNIPLLQVSRDATKRLMQAGIPVGIFGPKRIPPPSATKLTS